MATAASDTDSDIVIETENESERLLRTPPVAIVDGGRGNSGSATRRASSSVVLSVTFGSDGALDFDRTASPHTVIEEICPAVAVAGALQIQGDDDRFVEHDYSIV